jgi:hypothetical protein
LRPEGDRRLFITGDPFVPNGVIGRHTLHDWNEVLSDSGR